jgi:homoserine dehydrogenase
VRVLLLGFGAVGRAFANLLSAPRDQTPAIGDLPIELVGVVDSGGAAVSPQGLDPRALLAAKAAYGTVASAGRIGDRAKTVGSALEAVDIDADVLVDATPSALRDPAESIARIEQAFAGGKHVVTVNKAPLAWAFPKLMGLALQHGKQLRYSGTVGAGTPVIALARESPGTASTPPSPKRSGWATPRRTPPPTWTAGTPPPSW